MSAERFEHRVERTQDVGSTVLNLSRDGWELVCVTHPSVNSLYTTFWKRPVLSQDGAE